MYPVAKYPVYDLDNNLLVREGTELTPDFMDDFCRRNRTEYDFVPLLQYGSIKKDLLRQFSIPPYDLIFAREDTVHTVLRVMEQITLPLPVFKAMDYFRHNDYHTYRHMLAISALSTLILNELDPGHDDRISELSHYAPSHDLGKLSVPLATLLKKTPLTSQELDQLRHHAVSGYVLLSHYFKSHDNFASMIALDHHERRNGTGYSRGIPQKNLIVEVTAVCDIYDALVAQRPYRPISYDNRTALEELTWMAQRGDVRWEPVQVLVAFNRQHQGDIAELKISLECRGQPPRNNVYGIVADKENEPGC